MPQPLTFTATANLRVRCLAMHLIHDPAAAAFRTNSQILVTVDQFQLVAETPSSASMKLLRKPKNPFGF